MLNSELESLTLYIVDLVKELSLAQRAPKLVPIWCSYGATYALDRVDYLKVRLAPISI